jgi:hypothetical protein
MNREWMESRYREETRQWRTLSKGGPQWRPYPPQCLRVRLRQFFAIEANHCDIEAFRVFLDEAHNPLRQPEKKHPHFW